MSIKFALSTARMQFYYNLFQIATLLKLNETENKVGKLLTNLSFKFSSLII